MKSLPQVINAEQYVLGACIVNPKIVPKIRKILYPADFYKESHSVIYRTIIEAKETIDLSVLVSLLIREGEIENAGGKAYVMGIAIEATTTGAWEYHAKSIKEASFKRQLIHIANITIEEAQKDETLSGELADTMRNWLTDIEVGDALNVRAGVDLDNVYTPERCLKEYENYIKSLGKNRFITGITEVDTRIRGVASGELLFIIARAGSFKTAIVQNLLQRYVKNSSWGAVFFSLEMPVASVTERYQEIIQGVSGKDIETCYVKGEERRKEFEATFIKELPNFFIVPTSVSIPEIIQYVKLIQNHHHLKIGVIGIDYLGLMEGEGKGEYEVTSQLARNLKNMAKLLNIPVIAISQTSRRAGIGESEIMLDHARGSGAIEEAADFVLGTFKHDDDVILKILKNRKGRVGTCWRLDLDPETLRLGSESDYWEPPKKTKKKDRYGDYT